MSSGVGSLLPLQSRQLKIEVSPAPSFSLSELTADKSQEFRPGKVPLQRPPGKLPPERDGEQRFPRMAVPVKDSPLPGVVTVEKSGILEEVRLDAELPVKPLGGKLEALVAARTSPLKGVTNVDTGVRLTMPQAGDRDVNLNARVSFFNTTNMTTQKTTENFFFEGRANVGGVFIGADIRGRTDVSAPLDVEKYAGAKIGDTAVSVRSRSVGDRPVQDSVRVENPDFRLEIGRDRGDDLFLRGSARWNF